MVNSIGGVMHDIYTGLNIYASAGPHAAEELS